MLMDKLRDEIIESEKTRNDLLKWKLILVAALGAAGLGIGSQGAKDLVVLLALVPVVCLYVDALCFHAELRILAIASFLRMLPATELERQYENHCKANRRHFSLEGWALLGTTVALSLAVFVVGQGHGRQYGVDPGPAGIVLTWAGGSGAVAGLVFFFFFRGRSRKLEASA